MKKQLKHFVLVTTIIMLSAISIRAIAQDKQNHEWKAPAEAEQIEKVVAFLQSAN